MDGTTLDQFNVFTTIAECGSFAAASRKLNRAQSAITYAMRNLEAQSGLALFDRSAYRPTLTEAGRALLPRARRVLEDAAAYSLQARRIVEGLEARLTLVLEVSSPMAPVMAALQLFQARFASVELRIATEPMGEAAKALAEGRCDLAVLDSMSVLAGDFEADLCGEIDLVAVAAPEHALAKLPGPLQPEVLRDHVQLVLTAHVLTQDGADYGVQAVNRWYVGHPQTKRDLLLAGLGWGSMPRHLVAGDLGAGRLVELNPARWDGSDRMPQFQFFVAHGKKRPLGPAARALFAQLSRVGLNSAASPTGPSA